MSQSKKTTTKSDPKAIKTKRATQATETEARAAVDAVIANDTAAKAAVATTDTKPTKAKAAKKTKVPKAAKPAKADKKPSGLEVAVQVLKSAGEPMRCKEMVETMLAKGLWTTGGKTPAATIYAAILREITVKGSEARFKKTDRGLFTLNAK